MNSLLIFAKAPIKGLVKTRLKGDTDLSDDETLELYKAFLKDIILMAEKTGSDKVHLSCYPKEEKDLMAGLVSECFYGDSRPKRFSILPQKGKDFDERFMNAAKEALKDSDSVVVIGSDLPHIQPRIIDRAQDFLAQEGGMVLGPSSEGGAYLVGVSSPLDFTGVFTKGIELENLVSLAKKNSMPLLLLDELTDIDVPSDLITFICGIKAMEYAARFNDFYLPKNTIKTIREMGLRVESSRGGERGRRLVKNG